MIPGFYDFATLSIFPVIDSGDVMNPKEDCNNIMPPLEFSYEEDANEASVREEGIEK
jgi:hypothetical protein